MNIIKKIYDWVLKWAASPYGGIALFILAFAESSFFPIPPDVLLIALVLGLPSKAFRYALTASLGSVIGGGFGYAIGYWLWYNGTGDIKDFSEIANFFFNNIPGFTQELFSKVVTSYNEYGFWIVFTAGFTPIPYKVFTITSGVTEMNLVLFFISSFIGRSARFFLVAWLLWKYGETIKTFIDKYFNILALSATALIIGGFVLIKYIF